MRLLGALKTDMKFQLKQGVFAVYVVITLFYLVVVSALPNNLHSIVVPLIVFSDPSVVGFFFIGGVIMLEKTQGVFTYLTVTPLRVTEYILSKLIAYALLAEIAGIVITLIVYKGPVNWLILMIGILLTSIFSTLLGFLSAVNCNTINQYFIRMAPYMLIGVLPLYGMFPSPLSTLLHIFPTLSGLELVYGAFHSLKTINAVVYSLYTILIDYVLFIIVCRIYRKKCSF